MRHEIEPEAAPKQNPAALPLLRNAQERLRAGHDIPRPGLEQEPIGNLPPRSAPVRHGLGTAARRPAPDLDQAMRAMRTADAELAEARANLNRGRRSLRTAEYTLNNYLRNPADQISSQLLGAMREDVSWKTRVLGPLQNRVETLNATAEERRRDVRAALAGD